jgi:hypothetical protein
MTPRPAGSAKHGRPRARGHARAPDTVHGSPPVPASSKKRDAPEAPALGGCPCQPHDRRPADHNGAQQHDGCPAPRLPLPPRLQFSEDILSNKHNMLTGLILLMMAIAVALAVPAGLVYIVLSHVPVAAKVSVGSVTTGGITAAISLLSSSRWRKRVERRSRRISEKPEG